MHPTANEPAVPPERCAADHPDVLDAIEPELRDLEHYVQAAGGDGTAEALNAVFRLLHTMEGSVVGPARTPLPAAGHTAKRSAAVMRRLHGLYSALAFGCDPCGCEAW